MSTVPRRIEFDGPERWAVWMDEDGCHIRAPKGDALEQPDMQRLVDIWSEVLRLKSNGTIPAPKPPTREERSLQSLASQERWLARRAKRAIVAEFDTDTDTMTPPF